jgi:hypothetical protein
MPRMGLFSSAPRLVSSFAQAALSLALVSTSAVVFLGCIDHLNNARVRSADEFECKRAEMNVVEVQDHIFVARGCGQAGAFRCETSIEGGCKRLHGKAEKKAIDLAPALPDEEGEATTKKKKEKTEKTEKADGDGDGSSKDEGDGNKDEKQDSKDGGTESAKAKPSEKSKKDDKKSGGDE